MPHPCLQPAPLTLAIALALSSLVLAPALAQPVTAAVPIVLPAQPLGAALNELARQARLQLMVHPDGIAGKQAPAVSGTLTPQQALDQLLRGSGLAAQVNGAEVIIRPVTAAVGAEASLGAVTVTANQLGEITEGTGSYTPGTIATATRLVLTPQETPQSVSVITRQHIEDFALYGLNEAIQHTPGISVGVYDSERSYYMARGFSVNNFQYDGIPMRRVATYSAGHTLSDLAIYDRVEVLKGSTGLLTGSGEPGASFNLIRKKPTRDFKGAIEASAGSWDNYRTSVDLSGALTESGRVRGRVSAAYQDRHSYQDHYEKKTGVFYGVLEWDLAPDTLLTLGADYQDNNPKGSSWTGIRVYDSAGNFTNMPRSFNNGARWSRWTQATRTGFATLEQQLPAGWVGKLQFNRQNNSYDAPLASPLTGFPDPATGAGTLVSASKYVGAYQTNAMDLYASGPFTWLGREHELVLGASLLRQHWDSSSYARPSSYDRGVANYYAWTGDAVEPRWQFSRRYDEITREQGIYVTSRLSITDRTKLILGGRVSTYRAPTVHKNGVVTPYAGVVHDLNDRYALYGSYTSIFSPQTVKNEVGSVLDPVEGNSYEIGLKGRFLNGKLNASVAAFRIEQDNYAVATGNLAPDGTNAYRAVQGIVAKGFEAEVSGQLAPGWQVQAGYTHKIARRDDIKVSTYEPENQIKLYTSYKPASVPGLTVGGGGRWQGRTWASLLNPVRGKEDFTQNGYWVVDAMMSYRFDKNLSAALNVRNLFDKKYYSIMDIYSTYTWGEPRSFNVSLRYDF